MPSVRHERGAPRSKRVHGRWGSGVDQRSPHVRRGAPGSPAGSHASTATADPGSSARTRTRTSALVPRRSLVGRTSASTCTRPAVLDPFLAPFQAVGKAVSIQSASDEERNLSHRPTDRIPSEGSVHFRCLARQRIRGLHLDNCAYTMSPLSFGSPRGHHTNSLDRTPWSRPDHTKVARRIGHPKQACGRGPVDPRTHSIPSTDGTP